MKRYVVVFEDSAQTDVRRSYEWGCRVGRYRVLFTIKRREVHVLHVRGAYAGRIDQPEADSLD